MALIIKVGNGEGCDYIVDAMGNELSGDTVYHICCQNKAKHLVTMLSGTELLVCDEHLVEFRDRGHVWKSRQLVRETYY